MSVRDKFRLSSARRFQSYSLYLSLNFYKLCFQDCCQYIKQLTYQAVVANHHCLNDNRRQQSPWESEVQQGRCFPSLLPTSVPALPHIHESSSSEHLLLAWKRKQNTVDKFNTKTQSVAVGESSSWEDYKRYVTNILENLIQFIEGRNTKFITGAAARSAALSASQQYLFVDVSKSNFIYLYKHLKSRVSYSQYQTLLLYNSL